MADQVRDERAKFEAWASKQGYEMDSMTYGDGEVEYDSSETWALWGCWQAATAFHAADVEALRSALEGVLAVVEDPKNYRIWAADLLTCCYTAPAFAAARAALKGDKP